MRSTDWTILSKWLYKDKLNKNRNKLFDNTYFSLML